MTESEHFSDKTLHLQINYKICLICSLRDVVMTKKQFDRAVQEVKLHNTNRIHHPDQHHNDPYRRYFDSDHQVNGPVKPVGQAAIKFMYTDWMDPKSTNSNMVRMLNPPTIILTSLTKVALDRMVGDYAFTCPVVNFAHYYARTSPPNEYDGPIPSCSLNEYLEIWITLLLLITSSPPALITRLPSVCLHISQHDIIFILFSLHSLHLILFFVLTQISIP